MLAASLGDPEGAFELLEKAIRHRENGLAVLSAFDEMESLRRDPRFESLRQQLKPE
ncbi:MAG TPA: hypothetical protein VNQ79_27225 [Blastocatellia bacterium]|nr:hypothetical protein [Blastocatellia bacterium]